MVNKRSSACWAKDLCRYHTIQAWWDHPNLCQIHNPFQKLLIAVFFRDGPPDSIPLDWTLTQKPGSPSQPKGGQHFPIWSQRFHPSPQAHLQRHPTDGGAPEPCVEFLYLTNLICLQYRLACYWDTVSGEDTLFQSRLSTCPHQLPHGLKRWTQLLPGAFPLDYAKRPASV